MPAAGSEAGPASNTAGCDSPGAYGVPTRSSQPVHDKINVMARRKATPPPEDIPENITDVDVSREMETSFLEYAYSVIYARALPDGRDGLKPVQRRILYSMDEMGLRPDRGHVKSSSVVGQVMGRYHPHGDQAIYDALVRMAQPFSLRLPLVDGHGNFGSLDDGPAAPRYTEARPAPSAPLLTTSLDENVVDFVPNYDNRLEQPAVLPAAFPNLLVNGASGIAVGMATNMPPHNLVEVIAAARHLLKSPDASVEQLMKFVPGPDLPLGGRIIGLDGIRDAYRSGRGTFRTRATVTVENVTARKKGIVVTELPYLVGPEKVKVKIREAVQAKKLQGIADVVDLTDRRHGLRLVIELKAGFNPDAVLEQLYRLTPMEESFGINNVCLVDGRPQTLGLRELLRVFVDHRLDVVRRRTEFRLTKHQDRLHLVQGLLIALVDIDRVIAIIRNSDDSSEAKTELVAEFTLSETQAEYILELKLRRLTKFSRIELETERDELQQKIDELTELLESDKLMRSLVSRELAAVAKEHGTPRRTVLLEGSAKPAKASAAPLEVADDPCFVVFSATGMLARTLSTSPLAAWAYGEGRAHHDVLSSVVQCTARGHVGAVTSQGRLIRVPVLDIPTMPETNSPLQLSGGADVAEFVTLQPQESVVSIVSLEESAGGVALGTKRGVVKRVTHDYPNRDDFEVISLKDGDEVIAATHVCDSADEIVFVSSAGQLLHFGCDKVRPQGRAGGGVAGIKLGADDVALFFGVIPAGKLDHSDVVTVAVGDSSLPGMAGCHAKVTPLPEFPAKGRATGGVRAHRLLSGQTGVSAAWVGVSPAMAADAKGKPVPLPEVDTRRDGSGTAVDAVITHIAGAGAQSSVAANAFGAV